MRAVLLFAGLLVSCASPTERGVDARPHEMAPTAAGSESRPSEPAPVSEVAPAPSASTEMEVGAPVLPDVPAAFASSKLGVILAVEEALRAESMDMLAALVIDAATAESACRHAGADERREVSEGVARLRAKFGDFMACLELVVWKSAQRLVLNYGTDVTRRRCDRGLEELEDSELFFGVGSEVVKVKLSNIFRAGDKLGLTRIRCSKTKGTPGDFSRLRANCPGPWQRVTQSDGVCPKP